MLKKNLIKKLGISAIAVFMAAMLITGCGNTVTDSAPTTATSSTSVAEADPSGEVDKEMPDGQAPDGQGGPGGQAPDGQGGPGGQSSAPTEYAAANEYTSDETVDDLTVESTGSDENAVHVLNGSQVIFNNLMISRNSSDSSGGDSASFYGVGASLLTTDGTAIVNGGTITSDSKGGAGLFAYGDGTIYAQNVKIDTKQDTSGGVHAAGGGTFYGWDLTVNTEGESSAAIRSDRGGGTMVIDGGTYTANGSGSPALYCTADISVNNATLEATGSEGVCLEGLNTTRLFDTDLTCDMPDQEQNNNLSWSVIVYQSMSGDSEVGAGTFDMVGGSITSKNGGLFYTTNTESNFYLSGVNITTADDCEFFLRATGNANGRGWGTTGENGADCNFTADDQDMKGDVQWDSVSKLDFYMLNGSTLQGAFVDDESEAGNGSDEGYANLYIDSSSTWTVTGDSTLTALHNAGKIVDESGNSVTVKGTDGTVYVEGDSEYTITVDSYDTEADTSEALTAPAWSDYAVEKPEALQ